MNYKNIGFKSEDIMNSACRMMIAGLVSIEEYLELLEVVILKEEV